MKLRHFVFAAAFLPAFLPMVAAAEPVTLINVYEVPAGQEEATLRYWERARDFMARQPGYRGTRLHRALSPQARFLLVNVAEWDSAQAFQAAARAMQGAELGAPPEGMTFTPGLYRVVRE